MRARMFLLPLLVAAAPAPPVGTVTSAGPRESAAPPGKVISLVVYGADKCPRGEGDEIVVCARHPEADRFRVPERLRVHKKQEAAGGVAWSDRVDTLEWVNRQGMPNSCSVNGSYGQTGCMTQFLAQARAERQAVRREEADASNPDPAQPPQ